MANTFYQFHYSEWEWECEDVQQTFASAEIAFSVCVLFFCVKIELEIFVGVRAINTAI